jgi:hypothetical protein
MTAILSKEQVNELTYKQCKSAMKLLNKTYRMDTPIQEISDEEWNLCDSIANTLLWLEDRIKQFEDPRIPSMDPGELVVKVEPPPKVYPVKVKRKFSALGVVYDSINDAATSLGIKVHTLRNYAGRHPDRYAYVN